MELVTVYLSSILRSITNKDTLKGESVLFWSMSKMPVQAFHCAGTLL